MIYYEIYICYYYNNTRDNYNLEKINLKIDLNLKIPIYV